MAILYGIGGTEIGFDMIKAAASGGMQIFQLREKALLEMSDRYTIIERYLGLCDSLGIEFVLNDFADLAIEMDLPALHVGYKDSDVEAIVKRYRGALGLSCYDSPSLVDDACAKNASYIALGSMEKSATKVDAPLCPLSIVDTVHKSFPQMPICLIGGINDKNASKYSALLRKSDMLALISYLWGEDFSDLAGIARRAGLIAGGKLE